MENNKQRHLPTVGPSSLLVTFSVICLVVFAVLCLGTSDAGRRRANISAEAVSAYYSADLEADKIFAQIRAGEIPEGVSVNGSIYSYSCEISPTQKIFVEIERTEHGYKVLRWQSVSSNI